ncbi:MAG: sulfotransferase [Deltaproteobacteria bacterium]|nr:sulfotransferase [Deltaproteobacteria bacterium]
MSNTEFVFVTGMFRSGTTFVGKILDAHPGVTLVSDPYLSFFKYFRSLVAKDNGFEVSFDAPLSDYYWDRNPKSLLNYIQHGEFSRPFPASLLDSLKGSIAKTAAPYSPKILEHLEAANGSDFASLLESLLEVLRRSYGASKPGSVIGFKCVWANEFIPPLTRCFPRSKVIQVQRDPRAVCASKNVTPAKYPWIFLGRQWRKLAALNWLYQNSNIPPGQVMTLYYEDMLRDPEGEAKRICEFLGVEYASEMIDPTMYTDGQGNPWKQNTSYGNGAAHFDKCASERWRAALLPEEIRTIERLCWPEMLLHGYQPISSIAQLAEFPLPPVLVPDSSLATWIKEFAPNDMRTALLQMSEDSIRHAIAVAKEDVLGRIDKNVIESAFLSDVVAQKINSLVSQM